MSVQIKRSSRLLYSELLVIDGIEFWDIMDIRDYISQPDDIIHTVTDGDRIDQLAHKYYQDYTLAWVIKWANNIEKIPQELVIGSNIIIPSANYIKTKVLNR